MIDVFSVAFPLRDPRRVLLQVSPSTEVHGGLIERNAVIRRAGVDASVDDERASGIDLRNHEDHRLDRSNVGAGGEEGKERVKFPDVKLLRRFKVICYRLQQQSIPY